MTMDPENCLQDVLQCHLCETQDPLTYCDICNKYWCKACNGNHLSDPFNKPNVETFKTPKNMDNEKEIIQKDLHELEVFIYPKYQEIASIIQVQKSALNENSRKLTTTIYKHGEFWHREIDTITQKLKSDLDEMDSKYLTVLNKQEDEITRTISEISQSIADLKKLLDSNDVSLLSVCNSRKAKFRRLPPKLTVSLASFIPQKSNKEQLYQQFGSLSALSIKIEEHGHTMESHGAESSSLDRPLIDVPRNIAEMKTKGMGLDRVSCFSDEEIGCGRDKKNRLYNLRGEQVKSIDSKSGKAPRNIAVTKSKDLVYTYDRDFTVNKGFMCRPQRHVISRYAYNKY